MKQIITLIAHQKNNYRKSKCYKKKDKIKNKIYPKLSDENKKKHYYYTDLDKKEWEFLEINGTSKNYYFKCSTESCNGFGILERFDKSLKFQLTKNIH